MQQDQSDMVGVAFRRDTWCKERCKHSIYGANQLILGLAGEATFLVDVATCTCVCVCCQLQLPRVSFGQNVIDKLSLCDIMGSHVC